LISSHVPDAKYGNPPKPTAESIKVIAGALVLVQVNGL